MPGYVNGIPHATSTDRIDLWPTTSRNIAQWVDENVPRNDDPRLTNARPPTTHTHSLGDVDGLQAALDGKTDTTDPRLSDARPPTAHTHDLGDVTGLAARLAALERDTGWRDVTYWLPAGAVTGGMYARRIGPTVHLQLRLTAVVAAGNKSAAVPSGFRPGLGFSDGISLSLDRYGNGSSHGQLTISGSGSVGVYGVTPVTANFLLNWSYLSHDPFPSTLPGDPA